jgi:hypothetical protein
MPRENIKCVEVKERRFPLLIKKSFNNVRRSWKKKILPGSIIEPNSRQTDW